MFKYSNPNDLAAEVKNYVIGQDTAVDSLSTYLFSYILYHYSQKSPFPIEYKPNALLIGDSGSGKTHLVKTLSKLMDFHFIEINAKSICQEGWNGESLRSMLISELSVVYNHVVESPWKIVFIDEIDKMCVPVASSKSDQYSEHVQASILKYLENMIIDIKTTKPNWEIDTSKICFIFAGNFQSIRDKRKESTTCGFIEHEKSTKNGHITKELETFGVLPELIGRLSNIIELNTLTDEDYYTIINNDHFFFNKYLNIFKNLQFVNIDIDKQKVIKNVDKSRLGVRAIIQEFNNVINKILIENSSKLDIVTEYFTYLDNADKLAQASTNIINLMDRRQNR